MKNWSGQFFPLFILAILAGVTTALEHYTRYEPASPPGKTRHDPDAIAEHFSITRFDQQGNLAYRLTAPKLAHYPDDDSSLMDAPKLISYRKEMPPSTITAQHGKVAAEGKVIYLWGTVHLTRPATEQLQALSARMNHLILEPEQETAFTPGMATLQRGSSLIQGQSLHIDQANSRLTFGSEVRGTLISSRKTP